MPYKSRAQQRLFHHLVAQGKLAPEVVEEYDAASKGKKIPQFVKRKAFGGQIDDKNVPQKAMGGEVMDVTAYRARGGEMHGARRGLMMAMGGYVPLKAMGGEVTDMESLDGDMKEFYPRKKSGGARLDDGKIHPFGSFAKAIKHRR